MPCCFCYNFVRSRLKSRFAAGMVRTPWNSCCMGCPHKAERGLTLVVQILGRKELGEMCIWELIIKVLPRKGKIGILSGILRVYLLYHSNSCEVITALFLFQSEFSLWDSFISPWKFWRSCFGPMGIRSVYKPSGFPCKKMPFLHFSSSRRA